MEGIIVAQPIDIKSLILKIRDTQVLLDSDVAMLYGYETKRINETASRNKERFPERFRFRLTKEESAYIESLRTQMPFAKQGKTEESLRSQFATLKRGQHTKYKPYAYTEGELPKKQCRLVEAWCELHTDELNAAWTAWNESGEVIKIEGLR
jgi:hypothetical protein